MEVVERQIQSLIPAEYNPRYITDDAFEQLKASIKRFDTLEPIIVNTHPERKNIIISGHQRVKVAKDLGLETFPTVEVSLTRDEERELNVRMNKNTGDWDWDELANHFSGEELEDWGFSDNELFFSEEHEQDAEDEWVGMPEFEEGEENDIKLIVNFKDEESREEFIEKHDISIEQKLKNTLLAFYPPGEREDNLSDYKYES